MSAKEQSRENVGKIAEIRGVVIDAVFPDQLPTIYSALRIPMAGSDGSSHDLIAEVQQHLGDDRVRAVAHGFDGRPRARLRRHRHRRTDQRARRRRARSAGSGT